jgi:hypothetical protein
MRHRDHSIERITNDRYHDEDAYVIDVHGKIRTDWDPMNAFNIQERTASTVAITPASIRTAVDGTWKAFIEDVVAQDADSDVEDQNADPLERMSIFEHRELFKKYHEQTMREHSEFNPATTFTETDYRHLTYDERTAENDHVMDLGMHAKYLMRPGENPLEPELDMSRDAPQVIADYLHKVISNVDYRYMSREDRVSGRIPTQHWMPSPYSGINIDAIHKEIWEDGLHRSTRLLHAMPKFEEFYADFAVDFAIDAPVAYDENYQIHIRDV